jgi:hypothetical protein
MWRGNFHLPGVLAERSPPGSQAFDDHGDQSNDREERHCHLNLFECDDHRAKPRPNDCRGGCVTAQKRNDSQDLSS